MLLALALLEHYALNPRDFENWLLSMALWRYVNISLTYPNNVPRRSKVNELPNVGNIPEDTRQKWQNATKQDKKKMKISFQPGLCSWKRLQRLGKMGRKTKKTLRKVLLRLQSPSEILKYKRYHCETWLDTMLGSAFGCCQASPPHSKKRHAWHASQFSSTLLSNSVFCRRILRAKISLEA